MKLELGEKGKIGENGQWSKFARNCYKKRVKNGREGIEKKKEGKGKESHQMS